MNARPVVLITGADGGLGRALTSTFDAAGWLVAAAGHKTHPPTVTPNVRTFTVELTDSGDVARLFAEMDRDFGRLDVLVNAGGLAIDGLVANLSESEFDRCQQVNLRGVFLCARQAVPLMSRQLDGHMLQIGSLTAHGAAGQVAYASAKAGLLGFTAALAREVGGSNIRVNAVLPGVLRTGMTAQISPARLAALAEGNTLGRLNELGEVARFIAHLAGTRNISGQVFQLDSRISSWT